MELVEELGMSYLVIEDRVLPENEYLCSMLGDNYIENVLECKRGYQGNETVLKYNISNMHSLVCEYDNRVMSCEELSELLEKIASIVCRARAYLLDERFFNYNPNSIYIDIETGGVNLMFIPYEIPESMMADYMHKGRYYALADFLLDKIDHKDETAVKIGYEFYRMAKEEHFNLEKFCIYMRKIITTGGSDKADNWVKNTKDLYISNDFSYDDVSDDDGCLAVEDDENNKGCSPNIRRKAGIINRIVSLFRKKKKRDKGVCPQVDGVVTVDDYWGANDDEDIIIGSGQSLLCEEEDNDNVTQYFDITSTDMHVVRWYENGREKSITLSNFPAVIGKQKEDVDLFINNPSVSRRHARLSVVQKKLFIEDLHSKNGTYLNGRKIKSGEEIMFGETDQLQFGQVLVSVV